MNRTSQDQKKSQFSDVFVPLKVANGVYKILVLDNHTNQDGDQQRKTSSTPQIRSIYTLISHGILSHTFSLLGESEDVELMAGIDERFIARPLATYETATKRGSHGSILDLTPYQRSLDGERTRAPISYRISFWTTENATCHRTEDTRYSSYGASVSLQSHRYTYRWVKSSLAFLKESYTLCRCSASTSSGEGSEDICECVEAAKMMVAPFRHPYDGSELWQLQVDSTKVSPIIGLLTAFAVKQSRLAATTAMYLTGKPCRPPKIIYNTVFQDEINSEKQPDDAESDQIIVIRTFDRNSLSQYFLYSYAIEEMTFQYQCFLKAANEQFGNAAE